MDCQFLDEDDRFVSLYCDDGDYHAAGGRGKIVVWCRRDRASYSAPTDPAWGSLRRGFPPEVYSQIIACLKLAVKAGLVDKCAADRSLST
jgi:hypothetical protein